MGWQRGKRAGAARSKTYEVRARYADISPEVLYYARGESPRQAARGDARMNGIAGKRLSFFLPDAALARPRAGPKNPRVM